MSRNLTFMRVRSIIRFVIIIQTVLFLTHYFLYQTLTFAPAGTAVHDSIWMKLAFALLSMSFISASLLGFRQTGTFIRVFYRAAAVWLGLVSFLFIASISSWIIFAIARLSGFAINFHHLVEWLYGSAIVIGLYGVFNASWTRITRATVRLANLPEAWRGRKAALI